MKHAASKIVKHFFLPFQRHKAVKTSNIKPRVVIYVKEYIIIAR